MSLAANCHRKVRRQCAGSSGSEQSRQKWEMRVEVVVVVEVSLLISRSSRKEKKEEKEQKEQPGIVCMCVCSFADSSLSRRVIGCRRIDCMRENSSGRALAITMIAGGRRTTRMICDRESHAETGLTARIACQRAATGSAGTWKSLSPSTRRTGHLTCGQWTRRRKWWMRRTT